MSVNKIILLGQIGKGKDPRKLNNLTVAIKQVLASLPQSRGMLARLEKLSQIVLLGII